MQRDVEHAGVVVEDFLGAVAVVDVLKGGSAGERRGGALTHGYMHEAQGRAEQSRGQSGTLPSPR